MKLCVPMKRGEFDNWPHVHVCVCTYAPNNNKGKHRLFYVTPLNIENWRIFCRTMGHHFLKFYKIIRKNICSPMGMSAELIHDKNASHHTIDTLVCKTFGVKQSM